MMDTIETARLRIRAASREEMEGLIGSEADDALKAAYAEMLSGCLEDPGRWGWHAAWMIELEDGTHVGEACLKGLGPDGVAEIGYGILEGHRGHGYATEAVDALSGWAFRDPSVVALEAEADAGDTASRRVLEKCGFIPTGTIGEEGPRYRSARR